MANSLNRYDAATAIPLLEKKINSLSKTQDEVRDELKNISHDMPLENLYLVSIWATRGSLLRDGVESTTLQATLYLWEADITNDVPDSYFTWTRNSGDVQADAVWNAANSDGRKNLTVIGEDVGEQSTFICTVNDGGSIFTQAEIIVASNHTLESVVIDTNKVNERLETIQTSADTAKASADEAIKNANNALEQADIANAEISKANENIDALSGELKTTKETFEATYATKGEITDIDTALKAEIEKNADGISSAVSRVNDIEIDSDNAQKAAQAAQEAADTAQNAADEAQRNYEILQQQANATDEELKQAKSDVESAQKAAQAAQEAADNAQNAADGLANRVETVETSITQHSDSITQLVTKTTEITDGLPEMISEETDDILKTGGYVTEDDLDEYATNNDLATVKTTLETSLKQTAESFDFTFADIKEELGALGGRVSTQEGYIKLVNGEIIIGQTGENASPVTAVYTNEGMEIRYNNIAVASYKDDIMEVKNVSLDNQIAFWQQWAARKGEYVEGKGYNLSFVWIGG